MQILLVVLIGAMLLPLNGAAQRRDTFAVYGPVGTSCGAFLASTGVKREQLTWWVTGFLTGVESARSQQGLPMRQTDVEGALAYVAKHCSERPLDEFVMAPLALVDNLSRQ
jgi:hypothetical protein